ncbi:unnamed protein product [Durusdinium trenchii]|uniref:Uncharacterized protein n=1 Tax=Durusdinium trenchii TaxID=1381693 RepID=A0ABP0SUT6_9DINO
MAAYAASRYTIPLEPSNSFEGSGPSGPSPGTSPPAGSNDMFVTIAVSPSDEQQEEEVARMEEEKGEDVANMWPSDGRDPQANAAREYLDKHNLVEFTQLLVQSVIKEQPERPYEFMARQFYFPEPEPRPRPPADLDPPGGAMFGATMATIGHYHYEG